MREILRYPSVQEIVLVDLDPEMTKLAVENPMLVELNGGSLRSPKVHVINEDALVWLGERRSRGLYDVAYVDFPDPHNYSLGKLYSQRFYRTVSQRLSVGGTLSTQSTSPWFTHPTSPRSCLAFAAIE